MKVDTRQIPASRHRTHHSRPPSANIVGVGLRTAYDAINGGEWPVIRGAAHHRILTAEFLHQYRLTDQASHSPSRVKNPVIADQTVGP